MRKFLLFWKYDQLELCLQKQSVLCDWLLTLITFVASLGIVDALFTSRFTKKIAAVKPAPHSDYLMPEVGGGMITGVYDAKNHKAYSVAEATGTPEITISIGVIFFIVVGLVLLGLLLWKFKIITRQYELKKDGLNKQTK